MQLAANKAIVLARKNVGNNAPMESSARLCLADAISLYDNGDYEVAKNRALASLAYSVGAFSVDYKKAKGV